MATNNKVGEDFTGEGMIEIINNNNGKLKAFLPEDCDTVYVTWEGKLSRCIDKEDFYLRWRTFYLNYNNNSKPGNP
jgi:hypothetical protein